MNAKMIRCAMVALMLMSGSAMATVYTWTGGSGDWHDNTKWTCSPSCAPTSYPSTTDDDAIFTSDLNVEVTLEADFEIDDLSLSGGLDSEFDLRFTTDNQQRTVTCDTIVFTNVEFYLINEAGLLA